MQRAATEHWKNAAWAALVATLALTPLAIGRLPGTDTQLTYTAFAFPQAVTLAVGAGIALALWAIAVARGEATIRISPAFAPFALLLLWSGVATVAAFEPLRSLLGKSTSALSLVTIAALTIALALVMQLADTEKRIRTLTRAVTYSGTAVALLALLQQLTNSDLFGIASLEGWFVSRGFSTMGNPDHLGTFLVVPAVLALVLALSESDARWRWAATGAGGITIAALVGTLTRGAWLGFAVAAIGFVVLAWPARRTAIVSARLTPLAVVCVVAVAISLLAADPADLAGRFGVPETPGVTAEASTDGASLDAATAGRASIWQASLRIAAARPLTGTGPAAYELGWYQHAVNASSAGGAGAIADDPHSLPLMLLATTGVPGLLAWLVGVGWALAYALRTALALARRGSLTGKAWLYLGWTSMSVGLHVALLLGAVSVPMLAYAYLGLAILLLPTARPVADNVVWSRRVLPAAAILVTVALVIGTGANLMPEMTLARGARTGSTATTGAAAAAAPWNTDIQKAHYHLRTLEVERALTSGAQGAEQLQRLAADLELAGTRQPHELYYPSVRAQVLTRASELLGPEPYAAEAIAAADDALAIMPAHIPTRVNKALALSDLGEWDAMAETLEGYWEAETGSAYPGILYAQALALSDRLDEASTVFDTLEARFPADDTIGPARQQAIDLAGER